MLYDTDRPPEQSPLGLAEPIPVFGGQHTSEKLEIILRYLEAYRHATSRANFQVSYIDAFAGAGYYRPPDRATQPQEQLDFDVFRDESVHRLIEGSARRALTIKRPFDRYVFVEKNPTYADELEQLKEEFPALARHIHVRRMDANSYLQSLARKKIWHEWRAVVFLDPFGMEVEWETVKLLAETQAIDLWYLFPVGLGLGRLLTNDGQIPPSNQEHLDRVLGTTEWRSEFYAASRQAKLFATESSIVKVAGYHDMERFVVRRLENIFCGVARAPYRLLNSRGTWLYSMFFAAGNPKGAPIALRIANHILEKSPWQRARTLSGPK